MRSIRVHQTGDPSVLRLEDVPDLRPGPGQVVVRVKAAGVNPVDTYIRLGKNNYAPKSLPYTPGFDAAGVVELLGSGVERVKVGDRVYCAGNLSGAYAEQSLCEASQVHPLPERISFAQGAGVNVPYATAYRALHQRAQARPGEVVLVHGASGGVGLAGVQWAKAAGMVVIGTASTEAGRQLVAEQGADLVLDHSSDDHFEQSKSFAGGRGVDVVLEMLANVNLNKNLTILAPRGRVVVIGSRGPIEIDPRLTMGKDSSILGMTILNATPEELKEIHSAIVAGLGNGTLNPIVGREFKLGDAPKAHEAVMAPGAMGKIVLVP